MCPKRYLGCYWPIGKVRSGAYLSACLACGCHEPPGLWLGITYPHLSSFFNLGFENRLKAYWEIYPFSLSKTRYISRSFLFFFTFCYLSFSSVNYTIHPTFFFIVNSLTFVYFFLQKNLSIDWPPSCRRSHYDRYMSYGFFCWLGTLRLYTMF